MICAANYEVCATVMQASPKSPAEKQSVREIKEAQEQLRLQLFPPPEEQS